MNNDDHATQARQFTYGYGGNPDAETAATDLLADMMHLADQQGWTWEIMLGRASMHYNAEIEENQ